MNLTPLGAKAAMLDEAKKRNLADELIAGIRNVNSYTNGVCYDVVAYVRYLKGNHITPEELAVQTGIYWDAKLEFRSGALWDGHSAIAPGTAVGFHRIIDNKMFHVAIAAGGTFVRSVNGHALGAEWGNAVDIHSVLKAPDEEGQFTFDNTFIKVYLSQR